MIELFQSATRDQNGKFPLGEISATPGVLSTVTPTEIMAGLHRHLMGDWGEVDSEGQATNERALVQGGPLGSIFTDASGTTFYVVTEADRSATTVLLPAEF